MGEIELISLLSVGLQNGEQMRNEGNWELYQRVIHVFKKNTTGDSDTLLSSS
jgi:hypothetical protein